MAHIAKQHPSANWLRVGDHIYRQALERNIALGEPDQVHFWGTELPALLQHPQYRQQAEERVAELLQKSDAIQEQVQRQVGSLLEEQGMADLERHRLSELLADPMPVVVADD
jgi:hypothetical protein